MNKFTKVKNEMKKRGLADFFTSDNPLLDLPLQLFKPFEMTDLACLVILQWVKSDFTGSMDSIPISIENSTQKINDGVHKLKLLLHKGNYRFSDIWDLCEDHFEDLAKEQWTQWMDEWSFYKKVKELTQISKVYLIFLTFLRNEALSNQLCSRLSPHLGEDYSGVLEKTAIMIFNMSNHLDLQWIYKMVTCHKVLCSNTHEDEHTDKAKAVKFMLDLLKSVEAKIQLSCFNLPYLPVAQVFINQDTQTPTKKCIKINPHDQINLLRLDVLKCNLENIMVKLHAKEGIDFKQKTVSFFKTSSEEYQNLNATFQMLKLQLLTPELKKHLSTLTKILSVNIQWHVNMGELVHDIRCSIDNNITLNFRSIHVIALLRQLDTWKDPIEKLFIQWIEHQSPEQIEEHMQRVKNFTTYIEFEDKSPFNFESNSTKQELGTVVEYLMIKDRKTSKKSPQL